MNKWIRRIGVVVLCVAAVPAVAQVVGQTYRLEYRTVCEQRQATAYRIEYETVYEEQQMTSYKPVYETAVREHRYTVQKPVVETSEREEVYTVQKPVTETAEREEVYTVMKPVYETAYRTEYRTVMQPVVTNHTQYVDRGCMSQQMVFKPDAPSTRLAWQSGGCAVDPVTGQTTYRRAGLYWTQTPSCTGKYQVQQVWHPNIVAQTVQQTAYMPQTVAQQVPMQVCKYVPEQVVRKVPVQVCRMVTEQHTRKVPVTTYKTVCEERVEQVPYQVCRMVAEQQTIRVPRTVEKRVPVTYTYNVSRVECFRIPLDACGNPIETVSPAPAVPAAPATIQQPTPAKKPADAADVKPTLDGDLKSPKPTTDENPAGEINRNLKPIAPPPTKDTSSSPSSLQFPEDKRA